MKGVRTLAAHALGGLPGIAPLLPGPDVPPPILTFTPDDPERAGPICNQRAAKNISRLRRHLFDRGPRVFSARPKQNTVSSITVRYPGDGYRPVGQGCDSGFVVFELTRGEFLGCRNPRDRSASSEVRNLVGPDLGEFEIKAPLRRFNSDLGRGAGFERQEDADGMKPDFRARTRTHLRVVNVCVRSDLVAASGAAPRARTGHLIFCGKVMPFGGDQSPAGDSRRAVPAFDRFCLFAQRDEERDGAGWGWGRLGRGGCLLRRR